MLNLFFRFISVYFLKPYEIGFQKCLGILKKTLKRIFLCVTFCFPRKFTNESQVQVNELGLLVCGKTSEEAVNPLTRKICAKLFKARLR